MDAPYQTKNEVIAPVGAAAQARAPGDTQDIQRSENAERADRSPRIIIVGAGFAGLAAARALRRADAEVLLIDRRNHNVFQPLLYQVATAVLSPADIAAPIRQLEARQKNLDVVMAEVTSIDRRTRTVRATAPDGRALAYTYDYLVIAAGARPSYYGHDEFGQYAPGLKDLRDAEMIRTSILRAFELADTTEDQAERARQMTFVLVGAGPSGVELAASLAHMMKVTLRGNFRRIDPAEARVILVDGAARVLPTFGEPASRSAAKRLQKLGVKIVTNAKVEKVDAQGVVAGGQQIPSATVIWTAGVAASPLSRMVTDKVDRAGRALVDPQLRATDGRDVFIVGDCSSVAQGKHPAPGVAQAAIQEGRYAGKAIAKMLKGQALSRPFRYFDKGSMAVVGKNFAVLERGALHTSGFLTWLAWAFVHILSLPQMQNRLRVQRQWLWSYFTGERSSRLIPESSPADETRQEQKG